VVSEGSLEQLASQKEGGGEEEDPGSHGESHASEGSQHATSVEIHDPLSMLADAPLAEGEPPSRPGSSERSTSQEGEGERQGLAAEGKEGEGHSEPEAPEEIDLEEHFRRLGAALVAGGSGEGGWLSTEARREAQDSGVAQIASEKAGGSAVVYPSSHSPWGASGGGAKPEGAELGTSTSPCGVAGREAGSGLEREGGLESPSPAGAGQMWLPDHFGEVDLDASCQSLLPAAVGGVGKENGGSEGAGDERTVLNLPRGTHSRGFSSLSNTYPPPPPKSSTPAWYR